MTTDDEDARAFRYGAQVANEAILRTLLITALHPIGDPAEKARTAAALRGVVEKVVALRLRGAGVGDSEGVEARSAASIVASVFDDLLAADALPGDSTR